MNQVLQGDHCWVLGNDAEKIKAFHRRQQRVWQRKPALRAVYREWCRWIEAARTKDAGMTLEIGGGIGNVKSLLPDVHASDLAWCPWLNAQLDATRLPVRNASLSNLICVDVLHHVGDPLAVFAEAQRCLKPGGRFILIEPYLSPVSRVFWRFHREAIDFQVDLFQCTDGQPTTGAFFDANQAIPTILFTKQLKRVLTTFPQLRLVERRPCSYLAYPLSLGYQNFQLIPTFLLPPLLALERRLERLAEWCAFRIFVVFERLYSR